MEAQPARLGVRDAATAFGQRESVLQASLSPDGTRLATVESSGARGAVLRIIDLAKPGSGQAPAMVSSGDPQRLSWCRWAGNTRLLCEAFSSVLLATGGITYANRIIAIDADGKKLRVLPAPSRTGEALGYRTFGGSVLDWNTGKEGHVLMARQYVPEVSTGHLTVQTDEGLGVDEVDSATLKTRKVEKARRTAVEFITDGIGNVRIMGNDAGLSKDGYLSGRISYSYRPKGGGDWLPLSIFDRASGEGFNPYRVDPHLDVVYGLKKKDGRDAAFSVALDGTGKETLVLSHPAVDVDDFVTIGRNRRVIGVTWTTDRRQVEYFDPELKKLAASLSRTLPDSPLIHFVDSSQDESKLLIWAGGDTDPGRYYLLNRATREMRPLTLTRWPLEKAALASVRAIEIPAADGTMIPGYLTLPPGSSGKNLPAIVLPHGGPSARDTWGFDWLAQFWAQIGYAVLQPNFRGSAGYGDAWFRDNGFKSWRTAIGDVRASGHWLVKNGIADPERLAIFGWSYGGYAALQAAAVEPELFRAVVAVAPVTDLGRLKEESAIFSDHRLQRDFIGSGPHIEEGSPARHAAKIAAPVLMFHGTFDRNVNIGQSKLMADRLRAAEKNVRLVTYEKLDHYLEDSAARKDMLEQSAAFMEAAFGKN